jgi:predicted RNA-binding protein
MCELTVFLLSDGEKEKVMEDVATITPEGDRLILTDLLGRQQIVEARIKELRLLEHKVFLTR